MADEKLGKPGGRLQRIYKWWEKAVGGDFQNPKSFGYSPEDEDYIMKHGLEALVKSPTVRKKILSGWDEENKRIENDRRAEEIVKNSPPPTDTPVPAATPTGTPDPYASPVVPLDPMLQEAMHLGKSQYVNH